MKNRYGIVFAVMIATFAGAAQAQEAEGKIQAAVDLHPVVGLGSNMGFGFGFDARAGYSMQMEGFTLIPEGVVGYSHFGSGLDGFSFGLVRFMGGARAVFEAEGVIPSAFAHVGFGSFSYTMQMPVIFGMGGGSVSASTGTAVLDFGGALDFPVAENFLLGGHAAMNFLTASGSAAFLSFGAQGTYVF